MKLKTTLLFAAMNRDSLWMQAALDEASRASGNTHPNPVVGAVIVQNGQMVATGYTSPAGGPHAEIRALEAFAASGLSTDAPTTLYVTLEPCCTTGRTPPCTEAIIRSGIRRVVFGTVDPNPEHRGKAVEILTAAGIDVRHGVMEEACRDLNLIFNHWIVHREPFIAAKIATTIDGRIATRGGLSKWVTSPPARHDVMQWRRYFPAIAVGANTVLADDPQLTSRIDGAPEWSPVRFVFDRNLITFKDHRPRVYTDEHASRTIVVTLENRRMMAESCARNFGLNMWVLQEVNGDGGLAAFMQRCREETITGVYIEGGAHLLSTFLSQRLLHYLFSYRAPKLLADSAALAPFFGQEPPSMAEAIRLKHVRHATFGDDQLMRGFIEYP